MSTDRLPILAQGVMLLAGAFSAGAFAKDVLAPLDASRVRLGGEIGRRLRITWEKNLLAIDVDRDFISPFRKRDQEGGYVGAGKLVDSLVRLAAHTGDRRLLERQRHVVSSLLATQEEDGYMGTLRPEARLWSLWDIHEMAYLVYGLVADHRLRGAETSLAAARRLADLIIRRWSAEPDRKPGGGAITVHMAVTGLEPAFLALHAATGEERYLDFCTDFRTLGDWPGEIVTGRWGAIAGHAYAHLCRTIAQLRLYRLRPEPRLLRAAHRVVEFLTREDGLVVTGTAGDHECWHDTQEGTINLGETCATAYLVRFLDELLRLDGDPFYADILERSLYNALFAAQSPDGRRLRYYTPFDGPRAYFPGDHYCCPNNFRRIVAELPGMVYYRRGGGLVVSLYTTSEAAVDLPGGVTVAVRQETDYPSAGRVALELSPSRAARFPLELRIPGWCRRPRVAVNGEPVERESEPGGFFRLEREWRAGDRVELELPLALRLVRGRKAQAGRAAVLWGPLVFSLGREGNQGLTGVDLRLLVIDPATLEGPARDDTVRPGGLSCRVKGWGPGRWYPQARHDLELELREFPDPAGEAVYFKVPDPNDPALLEDELLRFR